MFKNYLNNLYIIIMFINVLFKILIPKISKFIIILLVKYVNVCTNKFYILLFINV